MGAMHIVSIGIIVGFPVQFQKIILSCILLREYNTI